MAASYEYTIDLCPEELILQAVSVPNPSISGEDVDICPCATLTPEGCLGSQECHEEFVIDICPVGYECLTLEASPSWDFQFHYGDYTGHSTVSGYVSWTNPDVGCSLVRVELWAAIPAYGHTDGCIGPGSPSPSLCHWAPLHFDDVSMNVCSEAGPCCTSIDPDCVPVGWNNPDPRVPPCCVQWPDGWPEDQGGELQCTTPATTEFCRQTLGGLSGKTYREFVSEKFTPGSTFYLFGLLSDGSWNILGQQKYQANGTDSGYVSALDGAKRSYQIDRGGHGTDSLTAENVDFTDHGPVGTWVNVYKKGCGSKSNTDSDRATSDDVCDVGTGATAWLIPVAKRSGVTW